MKDQNYSCYNSEFHATHNHQVKKSEFKKKLNLLPNDRV